MPRPPRPPRSLLLLVLIAVTGCLTPIRSAEVRTPAPSTGWLRIRYEVCSGIHGVLITGVEPGLAGDRAGLREGDILDVIAGASVGYDELSLEQALSGHHPGDPIEVRYVRDGATRQTVAELDPPPTVAVTTDLVAGCHWGSPRRPRW